MALLMTALLKAFGKGQHLYSPGNIQAATEICSVWFCGYGCVHTGLKKWPNLGE